MFSFKFESLLLKAFVVSQLLIAILAVGETEVTCTHDQKPLNLRLFKSDFQTEGWNGATYEIHKVADILGVEKSGSFMGSGLVETVDHCLDTSMQYLLVIKTPSEYSEDIGLEVCGNSFVKPNEMLLFYMDADGHCSAINNNNTPEEKSLPLKSESGVKAATFALSFFPTEAPTEAPTFAPTFTPTFAPTFSPTFSPTFEPTYEPTNAPTSFPTVSPTAMPSSKPTKFPTAMPTATPTLKPALTFYPTRAPTPLPPKVNWGNRYNVTTEQEFTQADCDAMAQTQAVVLGLPYDYTSCTFYIIRRLLESRFRMLSTTSNVFATVHVSIPLIGDYAEYASNPDQLYVNLNQVLYQAVMNSTVFQDTLVVVASNLGANATAAADVKLDLPTLPEVQAAPTSSPTFAPTSSNDHKLTTSEKAAIGICSIFGAGMLVSIVYFVMYMQTSKGDEYAVDDDQQFEFGTGDIVPGNAPTQAL